MRRGATGGIAGWTQLSAVVDERGVHRSNGSSEVTVSLSAHRELDLRGTSARADVTLRLRRLSARSSKGSRAGRREAISKPSTAKAQAEHRGSKHGSTRHQRAVCRHTARCSVSMQRARVDSCCCSRPLIRTAPLLLHAEPYASRCVACHGTASKDSCSDSCARGSYRTSGAVQLCSAAAAPSRLTCARCKLPCMRHTQAQAMLPPSAIFVHACLLCVLLYLK